MIASAAPIATATRGRVPKTTRLAGTAGGGVAYTPATMLQAKRPGESRPDAPSRRRAGSHRGPARGRAVGRRPRRLPPRRRLRPRPLRRAHRLRGPRGGSRTDHRSADRGHPRRLRQPRARSALLPGRRSGPGRHRAGGTHAAAALGGAPDPRSGLRRPARHRRLGTDDLCVLRERRGRGGDQRGAAVRHPRPRRPARMPGRGRDRRRPAAVHDAGRDGRPRRRAHRARLRDDQPVRRFLWHARRAGIHAPPPGAGPDRGARRPGPGLHPPAFERQRRRAPRARPPVRRLRGRRRLQRSVSRPRADLRARHGGPGGESARARTRPTRGPASRSR